MITLIFSITGLLLYIILNYFFVAECFSRIGSIVFGILSLVPFIGAFAGFTVLITGILHHRHLNDVTTNDRGRFAVRDTKLNRWLFNDINWERYDALKDRFGNKK
jgi:hypothetical protein